MTSINIELDGLSQLLSQLQKLGGAGDEVVLETITDIVTDTHSLAIAGIEGGPKTGRVYDTRFWIDGQGRVRRGEARVPHQASAAGQYPANDTGRLAGSIRMELPAVGNMVGRVGTNVAYGPMLEFGTSRMAARPWLLPSFIRAKLGVEKELRTRLEGKL
jgi:phage gpG-like protein